MEETAISGRESALKILSPKESPSKFRIRGEIIDNVVVIIVVVLVVDIVVVIVVVIFVIVVASD